MKYIVFGDFENKANYLVKDLGKGFSILELSDEEVKEIKNKVERIEPDYIMELNELTWRDIGNLGTENVLIATIGHDFEAPQMQYTYDMIHQKWKLCHKEHDKGIWIHCFSQTCQVLASELLLALNKLKQLSEMLQKLLIIVGDFESVLPYFKTNSLTEKVIETYLAGSLERLIKIGNHSATYSQQKLKETLHPEMMRSTERMMLYNDDPFYKMIPEDQKIYVPLDLLENKFMTTYYEKLGLNLISLGKRNAFFYDEKHILDENRPILFGNVLPNFVNPILTKVPIDVIQSVPMQSEQLIKKNSEFTGQGVLIGIVSETGIDYVNPCLRTSTGETRILDYWIQIDGVEGINYTSEQINEAIQSETFNETVPWEENEEYNTLLLGLAGGGKEGIDFMATDAQFLVSKINTAPKTLQAIYGGDTDEPAVLMPDILIAIDRMLTIAQEADMPLVLLLPYNTNLSSHDGTGIYEHLLETIGSQQGCSIIVPAGDEGNKAHHVSIVHNQTLVPSITFKVPKATPNLIGCIHLTNFKVTNFNFYPVGQKNLAIHINEKGTYQIENTTITTTGIITNFQNGACVINFRIENMNAGKWQLDCKFDSIMASTKVDMWIGQQALNHNVILDPFTVNKTLGSNAAINTILSVGAFDQNNLVVLALSGRGYNWVEEILPICAVIGRVTVVDGDDVIKYDIESTALSASFLAGAIAILYERWIKDKGKPYANSVVMQKRLINYLKQFAGLTYPNTSQGYGVFELQHLSNLTP